MLKLLLGALVVSPVLYRCDTPWDSLDVSEIQASYVEVGGFVTSWINKEDQTVGCWGYWQPNYDLGPDDIPCEPPEDPNQKYIYITGSKHACLLRDNHTAICWGGQSFQDAPDPTDRNPYKWGRVPDEYKDVQFRDITAGCQHT